MLQFHGVPRIQKMPHVSYEQQLCSQSSFKLEYLPLSLSLGSIYSCLKTLLQLLFLKIVQDKTQTSQRLPPLNSYSTECLVQLSGIQPVLILSLATFLCTYAEFPIRCPFQDNLYMSTVSHSLTPQICNSNFPLPYWNSKFNIGKTLPSLSENLLSQLDFVLR